MKTELPLAGLRVLDLSTEIAGPYCTKMLIDAGAEVIKIEPPAGDPLRRWTASGSRIPEGQDGALFQHLNASKRSVVLDLDSVAGREQLLQVSASADVVIESFEPGTLDRLGLGLVVLQARNPRLSLVSITPWGGTGPWAQRPATEFTLQAATGATERRGISGRVPVAAGGRIGEWVAGTFAAVGALCAWRSARETGKGQHVDLSMFECMFLTLAPYCDIAGQWRGGLWPRGMEVPSIEPAKDGWVGFCTQSGQQWQDFCVLINRPDIGEDQRYVLQFNRAADLPFMQQVIHEWTRQHTVDEIIELATALRIPVAPVGNGQNIPHIDQFVARGVFSQGPGGFPQPRPPYRLEHLAPLPFGRAPKLGEHTKTVLDALRSGAQETAGPPAQQSARPAASRRPLEGLRVLDLTAMWAGPFATSYMSDMGADVLKVESIQRPDGMRFVGGLPNEPMWEWGPVFAGANPGKRDITLDLTTADGQALLQRLIRQADVVVENFSVRVLDQFGITWDLVRGLNPRAIMVRMPSFGLDGPWRDRTGWAMTMEQVSGMAWLTGYEDLPLVVRGVCDPAGGMNAVFAVLLALEERQRTGKGQHIEVPLVEGALNLAVEQVIEYAAYGKLLERVANRGPYAAPQGVYPCAEPDTFVAVAVATDAQWTALREVMGDPVWARDPALGSAAGRRAAHDVIDRELAQWCAPQPREIAAERLVAAGVPAQVLINAHHAWDNPQLAHRRFFQVMNHPVTGPTRYPGLPMAFSALPRDLHRAPPPTLGQHNEAVLGAELGLSAEERERLRQCKVIGERPAFLVTGH